MDVALDKTRPPLGTPGGDAQPAAQPESELRALIAVAAAVAAAHRLEDVLEVVAEETCRVVGASSVSISRWDREHDRVRTLINVGELGPGEERFPTAETYALADYPLAARLLAESESYVVSRADEELGPHDRQLLDALDKGSYIGVPVIFDGRRGASSRRSRTSVPRRSRAATCRSWRRSPGRWAPRSAARSCSPASTSSPTRTRSPASVTAARSTNGSSRPSHAAARSRSRSAMSTGSS